LFSNSHELSGEFSIRIPQSTIVNPVARPPRLSEQTRDGGQAHPSPRSRDEDS
jgi:hypothetical protein